MKKWIRGVLMAVLLAVFAASAVVIGVTRHRYAVSRELYETASAAYTAPAEQLDETQPPITVDFDRLLAVNDQVVGWLYCEGTNINYPVVQGRDNDYYLHRSYDGVTRAAGSIFVEASNAPAFADANTIIYGHNMKDGSMFASLENWVDQAYYEAHPVMWLLTPEQDYEVVLLAGYTTSADSDTYAVFPQPDEALQDYLSAAMARSDFTADVALDTRAHYVVLSTCSYVFDNARSVLHGMLVPAASAGGVPFGTD